MLAALRLAVMVLVLMIAAVAHGDTFGSGANAFEIDFVPIGHPGNPDDVQFFPHPTNPITILQGKVDYTYRMGKYEISEEMIDKANALGNLGITHNNRGPDKPATYIDWFEAAEFVNWLNTSNGYQPAYDLIWHGFDADGMEVSVDLANGGMPPQWTDEDSGERVGGWRNVGGWPRNKKAYYFLPDADEWYKAAYYDPTAEVYYDYPAGSNDAPTPVASGTDPGTAVYMSRRFDPADIMLAGGPSPYGTVAQGGNVFEWQDTGFFVNYDDPPQTLWNFVYRGGSWNSEVVHLHVTHYESFHPTVEEFTWGFRVASIPEPNGLVLTCGLMAWLSIRHCLRTPNKRPGF